MIANVRIDITVDKRNPISVLLKRKKTVIGKCKLYKYECGGYFICNFIVYKRFRRQGYGDKLMSMIITRTNENLYLFVKPENKAAISLYEKHGFEFVCESGIMRKGKLSIANLMKRKHNPYLKQKQQPFFENVK